MRGRILGGQYGPFLSPLIRSPVLGGWDFRRLRGLRHFFIRYFGICIQLPGLPQQRFSDRV